MSKKFKSNIRRQKPTNEDLPALKNVLAEIEGQDIDVQDFVLLIAPHTGDKGVAITKVMTSDLNAFRRMVEKVYDTMTKDVGDVLANEQMELARMYADRQRILIDKSMRALREINDICPGFNFEEYYKDPDKYLANLFKIEELPDEEELEAMSRQIAYHRLQWMRSEGERLQAENQKLQERLKSLKKIQNKDIMEIVRREEEAERNREEMEREQAVKQNQLQQLNNELEKAIVVEEKKATIEKKIARTPRLTTKKGTKVKSKVESWNVKAAKELKEVQLDTSKASVTSRVKRALTMKGKKKKPTLESRPAWQDVDVEEFQAGETAAGPSSPGRSMTTCPPTCAGASPPHRSSPPPPQPQRYGRHAHGPTDTWKGFQ